MTSLVTKIKKGRPYYYAVDSARVNGKPRIIKQVYLGTIEKMMEASDLSKGSKIQEPDHAVVLEFGAIAALLDLAERLGVRQIINDEVGKRSQGLPVGDSILLAAINRAVRPVSKNVFFEDWFLETVLPNSFPLANKKNLSSQGYWNNMSLITSEAIRNIEDKITAQVVQKYNISTNCLLFDNTNFISYIDTDNPSTLAKRGKSKEHRSDLRIVGLSLMVSPENNIPLFHEPYPGNTNDAKRFSEIIDSLKSRCQKIQQDTDLTLVFDRGNNSASNIEKLIQNDPFSFHYVGGLKQNQCQDLLMTPKEAYQRLEGDTFGETTAFRATREEFGKAATVVVTDNPDLFRLQMRGITNNIEKCRQELTELAGKLKEREGGKKFRGQQYTEESVLSKVKNILTAEHMKNIFEYDIKTNNGYISLDFNINEEKFSYIKDHILGKSVLFTDRHEWTNEQIVGAYRAQYHVEECFKQMKNNDYLTFTPIRHYTDKHIAVHSFYCVLALTLASVLNLEFKRMGYKISINTMLKELVKIKQVINYYILSNKNINKTTTFTEIKGIVKEYIDKYNLLKHASKI
ncbi:MAG: IS1634 family transposase [Deltaproteobacteria bacterium]|jgi:transposase|nr:IS1634 family transposase [Deltaproteobacteria bacterium]